MKFLNKLQYKDWMKLKSHLLWCYDGKLNNVEMKERPTTYSQYKNNGAWLIRKGWAEVSHDANKYRAEAGQWLIVKPTDRIQSFSQDAEILSIAFDAKWPDGEKWLSEGLSFVFEAQNYPQLEAVGVEIAQLCSSLNSKTWDIRQSKISPSLFFQIQAQLSLWFSHLLEVLKDKDMLITARSSIEERVLKAIRLIESHELHLPLNQDYLASEIGISPVHLSRLFKKELQMTPHKYFEKLRLESACRRLSLPRVRISEVSQELGFRHLSHFSKWFSQHKGQSPQDFAQSFKTN